MANKKTWVCVWGEDSENNANHCDRDCDCVDEAGTQSGPRSLDLYLLKVESEGPWGPWS